MATLQELDDEQAYEAEISQCVGVTGYHHWFFLAALADGRRGVHRAGMEAVGGLEAHLSAPVGGELQPGTTKFTSFFGT